MNGKERWPSTMIIACNRVGDVIREKAIHQTNLASIFTTFGGYERLHKRSLMNSDGGVLNDGLRPSWGSYKYKTSKE